jgi:hypothetical protein
MFLKTGNAFLRRKTFGLGLPLVYSWGRLRYTESGPAHPDSGPYRYALNERAVISSLQVGKNEKDNIFSRTLDSFSSPHCNKRFISS